MERSDGRLNLPQIAGFHQVDRTLGRGVGPTEDRGGARAGNPAADRRSRAASGAGTTAENLLDRKRWAPRTAYEISGGDSPLELQHQHVLSEEAAAIVAETLKGLRSTA